jgi:glycosyltransferase involved in cell wall biosynthesis
MAPLPEKPSLLFFGRISEYKGLDVLLDAMPAVWSELPEVEVVIAGEGELPASSVLDDERVTVRNDHIAHEDLPGLFAASTCFVLPYRQASQSGVALRGREHGRAVIATTVGGIPDVVSDQTGRLVPPDDPAALAQAIVEVVGTPGLAERLGRAGADEVAAVGWDRVAALVLEAYERYL